MRLLRCHIENFGVLHDYEHTFAPGLTVICEENGFGKSTFAAFLKAMLYGFPRTGARNVIENERKRYDPWQGGKYGGFLEFEYQGNQYRVTRYFGKTAAKDSFSVMDLTTRQTTERFTEKLGEELFQLDAESFARSTYMPQNSGREMEATASIRTKLTNLVDNTNDMNNFDTATAALRLYRSRFKAYRGPGGQIGELEQEYRDLERQKFEAEGKKPQLQEVLNEIGSLDREKKEKNDVLADLREKIRRASVQKARQIRREQLQTLKDAVERQKKIIEKLDREYPFGYPAQEQLRTQRENLGIIQQTAQRLERLEVSREDRAVLDREGDFFADPAQVSRDLETCEQKCSALTEVSAKLSDRMLPEEARRWETLSAKFACGIPDRERLACGLQMADALHEAQLRLSAVIMDPESQKKLEKGRTMFRQGLPEERVMRDCRKAQQDRNLLQSQWEAASLSGKEQEEYQTLRRTFASGLPSEEEIRERQQDCRRILELTSIKNTKTTRVQEENKPERPQSRAPMLLVVLGVLLLVGGIVCFARHWSLPGGLLLAGGLVGLLAGIWLHAARGFRSRGNISVITISAITDQENQELYDLQRSVNDFLLRYFSDVEDPESKLIQLLLDRKDFATLHEKKSGLEQERKALEKELQEKERFLHGVFRQYFPDRDYEDGFVQELQETAREYASLQSQAEDIRLQRQELSGVIEANRVQIIGLLRDYYPVELPEDLRQGMRDLASEAEAYEELSRKKQAIEAENAGYQAKQRELTGELRETLSHYGVEQDAEPLSQGVRELRRRLEDYKTAAERASHVNQDRLENQERQDKAQRELDAFFASYGMTEGESGDRIEKADEDIRSHRAAEDGLREAQSRLAAFLAESPAEGPEEDQENLPEPETLQEAEQGVQAQLDAIEAQLRQLRQERDILRRAVEQIPAWEDRMNWLETQRREAQRKCGLAERTLALLDQARDNLTNSYVGRVEQGFQQYAGTLLGDRMGRVMVDRDLKLHMDEQGAAREVGSFSAGMADSILLCMRLSLIDALFTGEKPFLILDDPFVNLDDVHTKRALELLRTIAQDHQVLYLVCNTGRT